MTPKGKSYFGAAGVLLLMVVSLLIILPGGKIPIINKIINQNFKLGLDLLGGTQLIYQADMNAVQSSNKADALQGVRDVIERRVNAFGISEPRIQTTGGINDARVVVELAGINNPDDAIKLIGETPTLDFRELAPLEVKEIKLEDGAQIPAVWKQTELTGKNLRRSSVDFDQQTGTQYQITLTFDKEGGELFENITERNIGKQVGIFLDGSPITAPIVQTKISGGQAIITGDFTLDEAKQLANRLNAGALPVPIKLISRTSVGPSLGRESLGQSLVAGIIGLIIMIIYMTSMYRYPGIIASFSLILYALLNLAVYKIVGVTMTLAGIAGFILSIGMAVDANILIFERLKEELRANRPLLQGVSNAFREAWDSIRDSNVSSLITCALLYMMGSSIVKGFALTLAIGIAISMFSAITVTRTLLRSSAFTDFLQKRSIYSDGIITDSNQPKP